jgi:hypothetical protein
MPITNRDQNKIRVTRLHSTGATVGFIDPKVNMRVRHGIDTRWITSLDSGNFQVGLSTTSGGLVTCKAYPHNLSIDAPTASGYGWVSNATASGFQTFGHRNVFSNGIPTVPGSGMVFNKGNRITTIGR